MSAIGSKMDWRGGRRPRGCQEADPPPLPWKTGPESQGGLPALVDHLCDLHRRNLLDRHLLSPPPCVKPGDGFARRRGRRAARPPPSIRLLEEFRLAPPTRP